jgi:hypothetical protein
MPENKSTFVIGVAVAAIAIVAGVYFLREGFGGPEPAETAAPAAPAPTADTPRIQNPLPEREAAQEPLPELAASDPVARSTLSDLFTQKIEDFLVTDQLVRKVVASVDNLSREKLAPRLNPVKPIPGTLVTTGTDATLALSEKNYERYTPFVQLIASADMQRTADAYVRNYPLFQEAYQELGYPEGYFNDRLVAAIDHLLTTPEIEGPILLKQPSVFYEYADPRLEALSTGQKALLRMGPEHARTVKEKLKEFRTHIAARQPPGT